jgi:hypothetical protein
LRVGAVRIDHAVAETFLAAIEPAGLEAALEAEKLSVDQIVSIALAVQVSASPARESISSRAKRLTLAVVLAFRCPNWRRTSTTFARRKILIGVPWD